MTKEYIKVRKNGVIMREGETCIDVQVPSFSTYIKVPKKYVNNFIKYIDFVYKMHKQDYLFYEPHKSIYYKDEKIFFGENVSVRCPTYGNYLEIFRIPVILDLFKEHYNKIKCDSVMSIIKDIKKIRGNKWA